MNTTLSNTRNSNLYLFTALTVAFLAIVAFTVALSLETPSFAHTPAVSSEAVYVQYIQGEKAIIISPLESALQAYRLGEKMTDDNLESVLPTYRLDGKDRR